MPLIHPPRLNLSAPQRYSLQALPSYRFIPGINAHPVRDPEGHSYGHEHEPLKFMQPQDWRKNDEYLFGVDLYNHAYWWESHEAWENVWHTTNKQEAYGQFLQGLIQISAAFIKWYLNQQEGLTKLYEIGYGRLCFVRDQFPVFMGLNLNQHLTAIDTHFKTVIKEPETWSDPLVGYPYISLT